jgi:hypothetical protein
MPFIPLLVLSTIPEKVRVREDKSRRCIGRCAYFSSYVIGLITVPVTWSFRLSSLSSRCRILAYQLRGLIRRAHLGSNQACAGNYEPISSAEQEALLLLFMYTI